MNLSPHDASRTLPRRQRRRRRGVPPEEEVQRDFVAQLAETIVGQVEQQRSVYKRALDEMLERPSSSSGASSSSSSADSVLCWKRRSRRRRSAAPARQPAPRVAKRVSRAPVRSFRDIIGHEASQMELISEREWVSPDGAARVHLLQPRVHKQHAEGECGYHALHNLQRVMLALSEPDEERAASMLDLSSAVFWEDYFNMERTLLTYSETQDQSSYPWRPDLIREGVLERPYLSALLKQHTRLQASMGGRQLITSLAEIATHQLDSIASIFNKLRRAANRKRTGYQHGFMLASTNHWNAALLSQRPGRPLEIVVLESRNYDVLHLDMAKVEAEAQAHPKLQDDAWGQYLYVASRRSCKQNVHKLCLCGSGTRSIHAYYLDRQVESLLRSFHTYVSDKAPLLTLVGDADGDESRVEDDPSAVSEPDLLTWLEHRYPPRMLVSRDLERIHEVGPEHFEPETREIFTRWVLWVGSQRVVRRSRAKDVRYFARVLRSFLEVLSE